MRCLYLCQELRAVLFSLEALVIRCRDPVPGRVLAAPRPSQRVVQRPCLGRQAGGSLAPLRLSPDVLHALGRLLPHAHSALGHRGAWTSGDELAKRSHDVHKSGGPALCRGAMAGRHHFDHGTWPASALTNSLYRILMGIDQSSHPNCFPKPARTPTRGSHPECGGLERGAASG